MKAKTKTFEEKMQRLEEIVRAMERGDVALEESLKLFQEGTELVRLGKSQNNAKQCGLSPAGMGHDAGTAALGKGQGNMIQNLVFPIGFADICQN